VRSRRGRAGRLALLAAALVLRLLSLAITRGEPAYSLAGDTPATGVARLLAGWGLIVASAGAWARRPGSRFGPLLVAAGLAWFLAEWDSPGAGAAPAFTASCAPRERHANPAHQIGVGQRSASGEQANCDTPGRSGSTLCYRCERRQVPERFPASWRAASQPCGLGGCAR
jgi:hypothetical protein